MALFAINRYEGDTDSTPTTDKGNLILQRLHEAAERKRKSLAPEEKVEDEEESTPRKKCKNEKINVTRDISQSSDLETSPGKKSAKKKKKKKRRNSQNEEEMTEKSESKNDIDSEDSEIKQSKSEKEKQKKAKPKRKAQNKEQESRRSVDVTRTISDEEKLASERSESEADEKEEEDVQETQAGQKHEEIGGFTVIGDVLKQKTVTVQRKLPDWLAKPTVITDDIRNNRSPLDKVTGLDADIKEKLRENGIKDFFPVQSALLPALLRSHINDGFRPHDVCCSAPTGSGKTLAYVLPIIQSLRHRVVPQIRALIVLPVQDLVTQVFKVFQTYCSGTNLKVVQILGKKSLANEQQLLVRKGPRGYHSNADILVSTPGRLVDHINTTTGFSLRHLQFLVIDEADRMMEEIKQDWLSHVDTAVYSKRAPTGSEELKLSEVYGDVYREQPGPLTAYSTLKPSTHVQKLLFSATLSQNPEKLQALNLFQPRLYTSVVSHRLIHQGELSDPTTTHQGDHDTEAKLMKKGEFIGKYTTPAGLTEYYVETDTSCKPLLMLYFIRHLKFRHILCFTNSIEATHRLYWLLKLSCDAEVREFSSKLQANRRNRILKQFSEGKIDVLICSDVMARGMDVDNVQYVVSYDSPPYIKTYIHRVGRTARAGKAGTALTLLNNKEIYHFKKMLREAGKTQVKELKVKQNDLELYVSDYEAALQEMSQILASENRR